MDDDPTCKEGLAGDRIPDQTRVLGVGRPTQTFLKMARDGYVRLDPYVLQRNRKLGRNESCWSR